MALKNVYSKSILTKLINEEHSCVTVTHCQKKVVIHPFYLNDVKHGVANELFKSLKKFDPTLNAFLMGYRNVKIHASKSGRICFSGGTEQFIEVDYYIFQPSIGSYLQGVVNKISTDHIGILVHMFFNATVLKPVDVDYEDWNCKILNIDDTVVFRVVDLDFTGDLPYIEGAVENISMHKSTRKTGKINVEESLLDKFGNMSDSFGDEHKPLNLHKSHSKSAKKDKVDKGANSTMKVDETGGMDFSFISPIATAINPKGSKRNSPSCIVTSTQIQGAPGSPQSLGKISKKQKKRLTDENQSNITPATSFSTENSSKTCTKTNKEAKRKYSQTSSDESQNQSGQTSPNSRISSPVKLHKKEKKRKSHTLSSEDDTVTNLQKLVRIESPIKQLETEKRQSLSMEDDFSSSLYKKTSKKKKHSQTNSDEFFGYIQNQPRSTSPKTEIESPVQAHKKDKKRKKNSEDDTVTNLQKLVRIESPIKQLETEKKESLSMEDDSLSSLYKKTSNKKKKKHSQTNSDESFGSIQNQPRPTSPKTEVDSPVQAHKKDKKRKKNKEDATVTNLQKLVRIESPNKALKNKALRTEKRHSEESCDESENSKAEQSSIIKNTTTTNHISLNKETCSNNSVSFKKASKKDKNRHSKTSTDNTPGRIDIKYHADIEAGRKNEMINDLDLTERGELHDSNSLKNKEEKPKSETNLKRSKKRRDQERGELLEMSTAAHDTGLSPVTSAVMQADLAPPLTRHLVTVDVSKQGDAKYYSKVQARLRKSKNESIPDKYVIDEVHKDPNLELSISSGQVASPEESSTERRPSPKKHKHKKKKKKELREEECKEGTRDASVHERARKETSVSSPSRRHQNTYNETTDSVNVTETVGKSTRNIKLAEPKDSIHSEPSDADSQAMLIKQLLQDTKIKLNFEHSKTSGRKRKACDSPSHAGSKRSRTEDETAKSIAAPGSSAVESKEELKKLFENSLISVEDKIEMIWANLSPRHPSMNAESISGTPTKPKKTKKENKKERPPTEKSVKSAKDASLLTPVKPTTRNEQTGSASKGLIPKSRESKNESDFQQVHSNELVASPTKKAGRHSEDVRRISNCVDVKKTESETKKRRQRVVVTFAEGKTEDVNKVGRQRESIASDSAANTSRKRGRVRTSGKISEADIELDRERDDVIAKILREKNVVLKETTHKSDKKIQSDKNKNKEEAGASSGGGDEILREKNVVLKETTHKSDKKIQSDKKKKNKEEAGASSGGGDEIDCSAVVQQLLMQQISRLALCPDETSKKRKSSKKIP